MVPTARRFRVLAGASMLALASACSQISEPLTNESYMLDRVNGNPLPAVLDRSSHQTLEILAGILELRSDGTVLATHSMRITQNGTATGTTEEARGSWRREGGNIVITFEDGYEHTFEAVAAGERLRTSDVRCTRDCVMAMSILHVFEFQKAVIGKLSGE